MSTKRTYPIRYRIDGGEFLAPDKGRMRHIDSGVLSTETPFGYADELFIASILHEEDGSPSVLLMDSTNGINPKRKTLEMVRDQIEHHLKYHAGD